MTASAIQLARDMQRICADNRRTNPGVWLSPTVEKVENLALQILILLDEGISPDIIVTWQTELGFVMEDEYQEQAGWEDNEVEEHAKDWLDNY